MARIFVFFFSVKSSIFVINSLFVFMIRREDLLYIVYF